MREDAIASSPVCTENLTYRDHWAFGNQWTRPSSAGSDCALAGVVVLVWREATSRRKVIESFTVPKKLEEHGWSDAAIA
jgi:hypothetical protein